MRILIRSLLENTNSKSSSVALLRLRHTIRSIASSPTPLLTPSHARFFPPSAGPLFLSFPPWKLSFSTTPLYLRGKDVFFPDDFCKVRSLNVVFSVESKEEKKVTAEVENEDRFVNLPNLVSIARGLSGPLIGWMIINEWYLQAFGALAISGASDWLDGFLARRMGINSVYGSYLDPLADKVLIGCVAVAMVKQDLLNPGLVGLVLFRDVGLVAGAVYKRASNLGWKWKSWTYFVNLDATHKEKVEPLFISKINTVFQLLLVASALLQPEFGTDESLWYLNYLSWLVASTTIASTAAYGLQHFRNRAAYKCQQKNT